MSDKVHTLFVVFANLNDLIDMVFLQGASDDEKVILF